MDRLFQVLSSASTSAVWWPGSVEFALPAAAPAPPLKVLLVVAHPDDESECAGTLYRITHELQGIVDQVIVTNGEGGQHFTAPALDYYGLRGNRGIAKELPRLRRNEVKRAGKIIGVRHHYFLEQKDTGFTVDPGEGFRSWNLPRVRQELLSLLKSENYDLVLTLLPTADTHGHHQTVAVLALEAVASLPLNQRPGMAGVQTDCLGTLSLPEFDELPGFPSTRTTSSEPFWSFDRHTPLPQNSALDHSIIVNWVIAEHKSQGMFQMEYGRRRQEHFWQFKVGPERSGAPWQRLKRLFAKEAE